MGVFRQGYWTGLPFSPPGDLPDPGFEPATSVSPALQVDYLPSEPSGKPLTVWITTNWKILKEMGTRDHLTCFLRNLYADQEATVKLNMGQLTGSKLGKEYDKAVYCHPAYLPYMNGTTCEILG